MQSYFLVCVRFSLVAKDVVATLEDMGLGKPLVAANETEALSRLAELPPGAAVHLALIEAAPDEFPTSILETTLDALGTKIVLISDAPGTSLGALRYTVLRTPFFTDDLIDLILGKRPA
ncbi:MAG: hypothetical protein EA339_04140 [Rhodobacteraceae bacterium]|nr:MAG: hypothetical protein EA339_04140 [Paracoccaceae bacterium]